MTVNRPTHTELSELNQRLGLGLSEDDLAEFGPLVAEALNVHDWVDKARDAPAPDRGPSGRPPSRQENPLGAWYWKAAISSDTGGPLAGKTVAVKDNICVAGLPMMNGTDLLEGYVPERDATVVRRVLEAGGTIAGKAVCESLCFSGASHTSDTGPVRNPYDPTRSSGGSSSGCAALLAGGEVDLALAGDQGGSIRGPSSWSGVYGLKPTYGLVPFTGSFPLEMTLDHLGPMARSSKDVALLLDVIAGPDGLDPRQNAASADRRRSTYSEDLQRGAEGLRIGILAEGFGWEGVSEPEVDEAVFDAAQAMGDLGAEVSEVSVPWHRFGGNLALAIAAEGATALLIHGAGTGTNWKGFYPVDMLEAYARGLRDRKHLLPPMVKLQALTGQWLHDTYSGRYYAIAQNLSRQLADAYDEALAEVDLLALPTTPVRATPLPDPGLSAAHSVHIAHQMGANTSAFNVSGHPAMSIPCALSAGLPVGLMLVGRRDADGTVLRAAHAFEQDVFHPPPPSG